ncbi:hypothetical protein NQZ68_019941 [Dissostichus eleginoides]|nr:hypothetical protein NQZ68_019941 [Dissostichus eleginoides]
MSRVIWTQPRSSDWWDTIASDFSPQQFMQNFRVSRESFDYICNQDFCRATMEVLLPLHIKFPDVEKLVEMATFFNNRWRAP